nr:hypothetical protein [Tanacetum cinerariifolium]
LVVKKINLKIKGVLSAAKVLADAAKKKVNTYTRRRRAVSVKDKGKAIMQEFEQPKKIKKIVQIQMSLYEELAQKIHEEEQARFNAKQEAKVQDGTLQGKSFYEVKEIFDKVYKQVTSFVPMESDMEKERTKRVGLNIQERSLKRQKTEEGSKSIEEPKAIEISQEYIQQMMIRFDRDDLVRLWDLVKERFSTTEPKNDKEKALEASKVDA